MFEYHINLTHNFLDLASGSPQLLDDRPMSALEILRVLDDWVEQADTGKAYAILIRDNLFQQIMLRATGN